MARTLIHSAAGIALAASLFACSDPPPAASPPKSIRPVTGTALTGTVGTQVSGGVTVRVIDYSDREMEGVKVTFRITNGDGSLSAPLAVTDAQGLAHTEWTLGETAGENQLVVSIFGIDSTATFVATGNPDAPVKLAITPRTLRIPFAASNGAIAGRAVDKFDNPVTASAPTYTSRNTGIATVTSGGTVTPATRGSSTWIIVTGSGFTDSAQVFTLANGAAPCTGITAMAALSVGEVNTTSFVDGGVCIPAAAGDREYGLVPFYDTPLPGSQTVFTVAASGITAPASPALGALRPRAMMTVAAANEAALLHRAAVDRQLRLAERREMPSRAAGARRWFSERATASGRRATRAITAPNVGDQLELNVNAVDFCVSPTMRTGRVVAVTSKAIVVADVANPTGGFTDADYASLGVTFDTLSYASDELNFGAPTDIDENGRVILFFTHAVNELGAGTLGFAYSRDLLPREGSLGSCPGSNVAELINLYVPDPSNTVTQVKNNTIATMGHELQHVINSARRLYVNTDAAPVEERWLNEGLSHVAEELLFYRSTGLPPRQNLGGSALTPYASAYTSFQSQNFARYFRFTLTPYSQSPIGISDDDDDLETRGAIWSFLRYAADQRFSADQAAFWRSLENSNSTGLDNLTAHIGSDVRLMVRDWALSNYLDDLVPTLPKYQQPSWNIRQIASFHSPVVCNLRGVCQQKTVTDSATVLLTSLSSEFIRFGVASGQEAYINAAGFPASEHTPLPRRVLLAIVRTK